MDSSYIDTTCIACGLRQGGWQGNLSTISHEIPRGSIIRHAAIHYVFLAKSCNVSGNLPHLIYTGHALTHSCLKFILVHTCILFICFHHPAHRQHILNAHGHPHVSTSPHLILLTLTYNQYASARLTYGHSQAQSHTDEQPLAPAAHISTQSAKTHPIGSLLSVTIVSAMIYERLRSALWVIVGGRNGHVTPTVPQLLFSSEPLMTDRTPARNSNMSHKLRNPASLKTETGHLTSCCVSVLSVAMMKHAEFTLVKKKVLIVSV